MALPVKTINAIHRIVDLLFDRINGSLLGPEFINKRKDKDIFVSFKPHLSLPGIYTLAAKEEAAEPNKEMLDSLVHVANGYIEAQRHATKAQIIKSISTYLQDAKKAGVKTDLKTVLNGELVGLMGRVKGNVLKIVASEANTAKNLGTLEGIVKINALNGISDPTVAFIGPNDKEVCEECKRVLYTTFPIPKVFKLSEVKSGYHKRGEDTPSMSGIHPHCFVGSTRLHTQFGLLKIEDLFKLNTDLNVVVDARIKNRRVGNNQFGEEIPGLTWLHRHASGAKILKATAVYETGTLPCLQIETERGLILEVSENHEMWIDDGLVGKKVMAKDLVIGDKIPVLSGEGLWGDDNFPELAELMGNLLGDGTINSDGLATFEFFGSDIEYGQKLLEIARPYCGPMLAKTMTIEPPNELYNVSKCGFNSTVLGRKFINEFGLSKQPRRVPNRVWGANKATVAAFLRGLYAADGHSEALPLVSISQTDKEFLREIQLLLSNFGIRTGLLHHEKAHKKIFNINNKKREVDCAESWRLLISGWDQVNKFSNEIGMGVPDKQKSLTGRLAATENKKKHGAWRTDKVKIIKSIGMQKTYCLTEPMTNTVTANGIVVGQCRHSLVTIMPGFGFSKTGKIQFISKTHRELEHQRS